MSSSGVNFENFRSTLEDISVASSENLKISETSRHVDIEQLYKLWQDRTAAIAAGNYLEEADQIIPLLYHENIIPFNSKDLYSKYAIIGTLRDYLKEEKRCNFTWAQRLKTCLGVAKGLSYLHSGIRDHGRVIHGCVSSHSIRLNKNLEAKLIYGVYGSVFLCANQPRPEIYRPTSSEKCSIDPVYLESGILNIESDIYSYGILMFEILTGMEADGPGRAIGDYKKQKMINLILRFHDDRPEQLIDPYLIESVDRRSFNMFIETAYKCISFNMKDRPTMDVIVKTIEEALDVHNQQAVSAIAKRRDPVKSFRISLEEIRKATKNFSEETLIKEGDGIVIYKGHFSDRLQIRTAAIKEYKHYRYDFGEGGFYTELKIAMMLHHENIARFIGYCDQSFAIVSEYAINGSLDKQLIDPNKSITWTQRLKICIGVAKGLRYLHSGFGEYQRVIHSDFSSRKILLYDNLKAKICGSRHSFLSPLQRRKAGFIGVGNTYYMDPVSLQSHIRNSELDVLVWSGTL